MNSNANKVRRLPSIKPRLRKVVNPAIRIPSLSINRNACINILPEKSNLSNYCPDKYTTTTLSQDKIVCSDVLPLKNQKQPSITILPSESKMNEPHHQKLFVFNHSDSSEENEQLLSSLSNSKIDTDNNYHGECCFLNGHSSGNPRSEISFGKKPSRTREISSDNFDVHRFIDRLEKHLNDILVSLPIENFLATPFYPSDVNQTSIAEDRLLKKVEVSSFDILDLKSTENVRKSDNNIANKGNRSTAVRFNENEITVKEYAHKSTSPPFEFILATADKFVSTDELVEKVTFQSDEICKDSSKSSENPLLHISESISSANELSTKHSKNSRSFVKDPCQLLIGNVLPNNVKIGDGKELSLDIYDHDKHTNFEIPFRNEIVHNDQGTNTENDDFLSIGADINQGNSRTLISQNELVPETGDKHESLKLEEQGKELITEDIVFPLPNTSTSFNKIFKNRSIQVTISSDIPQGTLEFPDVSQVVPIKNENKSVQVSLDDSYDRHNIDKVSSETVSSDNVLNAFETTSSDNVLNASESVLGNTISEPDFNVEVSEVLSSDIVVNASETVSGGEIHLPSFEICDLTLSEGEIGFEASISDIQPGNHIAIKFSSKEMNNFHKESDSMQCMTHVESSFSEPSCSFLDKLTQTSDKEEQVEESRENSPITFMLSEGEVLLDRLEDDEIETLQRENEKFRSRLASIPFSFLSPPN